MSDINSRAMLAALKISVWTARRFDKSITVEVNNRHGAAPDAGRYNKNLLGGAPADSYKAVTTAAGDLRTFHYAQTLAWSDEGSRLLPTTNWVPYSDGMRIRIATFESAVAAFVADYPALKAAAASALNGMYNPLDYPTPSEMPSKFAAVIKYAPVPCGDDFRLSLPEDEINAIRVATELNVQAAVADAMSDVWSRLADVVGRVEERLSTPGAIFRDTLIQNVADLTSAIGRLNVTNDPALDAMRREVETKIATVSPQDLRDDGTLRQSKAREAADILARIQGIMAAPPATT